MPSPTRSGSAANVRLTGEIADGWLGFHLVPSILGHYLPTLKEGLAKRTDGKTLADFDISSRVGIIESNDVKATLQVRFAQGTPDAELIRKVATLIDDSAPAGFHTVRLDAGELASGVYFYKLTAGGFTEMKKMVLRK